MVTTSAVLAAASGGIAQVSVRLTALSGDAKSRRRLHRPLEQGMTGRGRNAARAQISP